MERESGIGERNIAADQDDATAIFGCDWFGQAASQLRTAGDNCAGYPRRLAGLFALDCELGIRRQGSFATLNLFGGLKRTVR
jgi:hypothetical protein